MPEVRITGGSLRGRKLIVPPTDVRPTSSRARQAYFNIVSDRVPGSRFLDLFSGTGIFSFEAVSRGAAAATAVEQSAKFAEAIARSAQLFDVPVRSVRGEVLAVVPRLAEPPFDLVYADPPYRFGRYAELLELLDGSPCVAPEALVAIEHRKGPLPFQPGLLKRLRLWKTASWSDVAITLLERG